MGFTMRAWPVARSAAASSMLIAPLVRCPLCERSERGDNKLDKDGLGHRIMVEFSPNQVLTHAALVG